ncbi:UDP-N-acetylenolpyruvoylglucosamine reductase [Zobellella denitrificans]|uniref:UDP-N-acetylmuramate dehydrogenase n=1 Tax=Zobellella denitrificans TaxID=347534 RepID=UPI000B8BD46E|nr:UDP-N-acetylmuramate dehydrogenase [Zobellella denitrificans]OXS14971.1 UDP-N-acetylenolpyruvoylglucosamine reductase [Zobellella denitrificans]
MSTSPVSLLPFNTFGLAQHARTLLVLERRSQLPELWRSLREALPLFVGEGSNLLFTAPFEGTVLVNRLRGITVTDAGDAWLVRAEGGESWHGLVCHTLERDMPGLENLALIPGTVGAAPIQNIGAYGIELAQFCESVESFDWDSGEIRHWPAADCAFGYRDSVFKHAARRHLILSLTLRLPKDWRPVLGYGPLAALGEAASPAQIFEQVCATRRSKLPDPALLGNAGSFFKNPKVGEAQAEALKLAWPALPVYPAEPGLIKLAAGWLIDQAGLKGCRLGGAGVHEHQALVLVNLGGATAEDIVRLAALVRERVEQQFGVRLEPEVRVMGPRGESNLDEVLACLN